MALLALVSACTPTGRESPQPTQTTPTASAPSSSPTASPSPDAALPMPFPVFGPVVADAADVVAMLHQVARGLPALKVDITARQVTLTVLRGDGSVASYRWEAGYINRVDSDIEYLGQATFDPADYPIGSAPRMFDVADLRGVRGELVLQVVEYRPGEVVMTVTSRPESETVFFRRDGSAVATLGGTSVADIADGIAAVVGEAVEVYALGFNAQRGYWADLPGEQEGTVINRSRVGGIPVFTTLRTEVFQYPAFDPGLVRPESLAKSIAMFQTDPAETCDVRIDMSNARSAPVVRVDCAGTVSYADLDGRDMTALIAG